MRQGFKYSLFIFSVASLMAACTPAPRTELTKEQKQADLYWMYSTFEENYAPLSYKESLRKFNWEDTKKEYLARASETKSNEEFYLLMHELVARFTDAHTSSSIKNAALPGRAEVAYLGFSGVRIKDGMLVTKFLPSVQYSTSNYPIKQYDIILEMDGKSLDAVVTDELSRYRNLGNPNSTITYLYTKLFSRMSTADPMPKDAYTTLKVLQFTTSKVVTVKMPWITKDAFEFTQEQQAIETAHKKKANVSDVDLKHIEDSVFMLTNFLAMNQNLLTSSMLPDALRSIDSRSSGFSLKNTFRFIDDQLTWTSSTLQRQIVKASSALVKNGVQYPGYDLSPLNADIKFAAIDDFKNTRYIPDYAVFLTDAEIFPTYITKVTNNDKSAQIAVISVPTFSPASDDEALLEFKNTLNTLAKQGVTNIVLDLLDNGGGSGKLALDMAQALSPTPITYPQMQLKISNSWLDAYEKNSIDQSLADNERELSKRVFDRLSKEHQDSKTLSSPINDEELFTLSPFGNMDLDQRFNVVAMVNEMCASACDVFSGLLQDNSLALIFGTTTMGAGGNVVDHYEAPNSHLALRQTESLLMRLDGSYIENIGVSPDIKYSYDNDRYNNFEDSMNAAFNVFLK